MADFLTTASTLTCPHGGTIVPAPENTRTQAGGAFVLGTADSFSIVGCPFTTSSSSPCFQLIWSTASLKNSVGANALNQDSQGTCIGPSGVQGDVVIAQTQAEGSGD